MNTLAVGIIGATGYSGETLVHLLLRHPGVNLLAIASRQQAGNSLTEVLPSTRGPGDNLVFRKADPDALAEDDSITLWFLALPHGVAAEYAGTLLGKGRRIIDLSADFRLRDPEVYLEYYGHPHPRPDLLSQASYVLPEWSCDSWTTLPLLAAPGCYPTSILLPLLPLLQRRILGPEGIVINSLSGISGAGKKLAETYLYCERAESAAAYGLVRHRHLSEIEEQLALAYGGKVIVQFNPHLAPMRRGIATTITAPLGGKNLDEVYTAWQETYRDRPFVRLLAPGQTPDTAHVTGSNRIDFSAHADPRTGNLIITSALDNLLKGASGQAVQMMNIAMGWPEDEGLRGILA